MHRSRIEVAVVATCLLIVASLVPPALLAARDRQREQLCQDRLRRLSAAFVQYESAHGGFPPRRSGFNDGNAYGGWGASIYNYLGVTEVEGKYDVRYDFFDPQNKSIVESPMPVFLCPSTPADRYVQIQSQASTKTPNPDKDTVYISKARACDYIASNGVLMTGNGYGINAMGGRGVGNERQAMTDNQDLPLSKITDGLSNTLLLIEQAGRPSEWRVGKLTKSDSTQFGMSPNARGAWAGWGSIAFSAADAETGETPGRGDSTDCSVNCNNWFGIYGFHEGGANVLFCDGSVRFVGARLDPLTFAYLTVRDDGHVIDHEDFVEK